MSNEDAWRRWLVRFNEGTDETPRLTPLQQSEILSLLTQRIQLVVQRNVQIQALLKRSMPNPPVPAPTLPVAQAPAAVAPPPPPPPVVRNSTVQAMLDSHVSVVPQYLKVLILAWSNPPQAIQILAAWDRARTEQPAASLAAMEAFERLYLERANIEKQQAAQQSSTEGEE